MFESVLEATASRLRALAFLGMCARLRAASDVSGTYWPRTRVLDGLLQPAAASRAHARRCWLSVALLLSSSVSKSKVGHVYVRIAYPDHILR